MAQENPPFYLQRVWIAAGISALLILLILLAGAAFNVLLLVLAGSLIALFFHGIADFLHRKTKWPGGLCLGISIGGVLLVFGALFWFMGYRLQAEAAQMADELPATWQKAKAWLRESPLGEKLLAQSKSHQTAQKAKEVFATFFKSTFGILGDVYVVLFLGIFFTAAPGLYSKAIIRLVPPRSREKTGEVLDKMATNLKKWLAGRMFAMLVVFVLTAVGLIILGVPLWLVLALLAGMLNFIPNFGPLVAMVPAVLIGLLQGPQTALLIAGLYILVQVSESNFITPVVQQKLVHVPPALIIIMQLIVGMFSGIWGLLLATPLLLIIMVLVQEVYIPSIEEKKA